MANYVGGGWRRGLIPLALLFVALVSEAAAKALPVFHGHVSDFVFANPPRPAPDTPFFAPDGTAHRLSDYRGRVVLLNFWASWCAACILEMPALERLQAAQSGPDFVVLTLAQEGDAEPDLARVRAFLKARGLTHLPVFLDRGQALGLAFGQDALPTSILIDRKGREVGRLIGSADWDSPAALTLIRFAQALPPRSTKSTNPAPAQLPAGYWHRPLAPQGEAPPAWSGPERSLAPQSCGSCHADKYAEWRSSYHARAFSPGLVGQLLGFDRAQAAACLDCHAPLAEQKRAFEDGRAEKATDTTAPAWGLAAAGNSCAGCHVRGHRRYGPPQRGSGATGPSARPVAHGGVFRSPDFERSEFCGACHQHPSSTAINGKPLENTLVEWRQSPQGRRSITCQQCHMPDRRHLWRGIHDPEMVAAGLTASFRATPDGAEFRLTNSGVGHAFPTYITPRVVMRAVALDGTGQPLSGTSASHVIQRVVRFVGGRWIEESDSRLLPGTSAVLRLPWPPSGRVRMWLEVAPDDFYDHEVYDALMQQLAPGSAAAHLIAKADRRAETSAYRLFETELQRPET